MFHPRQLLELSERHPETALAYIQFLRELGGGRFLERSFERKMGLEYFERMFHPRQLLELSERYPEIALAYLQMYRETGGMGFLQRYFDKGIGPEFFERSYSPFHFNQLFDRSPVAIAVWLTLARIANSSDTTESVARAIFEFFRRRGGTRTGAALLPISVLPDLHWLATESKNAELGVALSELNDPSGDPSGE